MSDFEGLEVIGGLVEPIAAGPKELVRALRADRKAITAERDAARAERDALVIALRTISRQNTAMGDAGALLVRAAARARAALAQVQR